MRSSLSTLGVLVALATAGATSAAAQPRWITPGEDGFAEADGTGPITSVGGDLELTLWAGTAPIFAADADATSFSGLMSAAIVIDGVVEIGTRLGFTWGEARLTGVTDDDGAAVTNPWLYGAYVMNIERIVRVRAGAGLGFPLDPRGFNDALAAGYAAGTYGLDHLWLWLGDRFSIVPFVTVEAVPIPYLYTAASLHLGIFIPSSDTGDADVDFQLELTGGARVGPILAALRFRAVWIPTDNGGPEGFTSLEPFVRAIFELAQATPFVELRGTINLDDPLGFGDDPVIWGLHLAGGAEW
jgi:hypothetical protein